MSKIAFIYPGQGAQKVGMGKDFYENSKVAKELFDRANEQLDFDLLKTCFEENEEINDTKYTQPAMVATCLAITNHLMEENIKPEMTAGLSLGEYAAIAAAGGMDDLDAVLTVRKRGIFMDEAVPDHQGSMMAVLGLENDVVEQIMKSVEKASVANYNCPGQIVITGEKKAVLEAGEKLQEAGAKRTIELNVSGPFHSEFLKPAGEKLEKELEAVSWNALEIPYVTNVDANPVDDIAKTKDLLTKQISSSVLWEQSMRTMIDLGVDTFVEIGPGRTLAGFLRKIDRDVQVINVSKVEDVAVLKEKLC
jgi:[acyl-carrier-protein] S-malonyltransferase